VNTTVCPLATRAGIRNWPKYPLPPVMSIVGILSPPLPLLLPLVPVRASVSVFVCAPASVSVSVPAPASDPLSVALSLALFKSLSLSPVLNCHFPAPLCCPLPSLGLLCRSPWEG